MNEVKFINVYERGRKLLYCQKCYTYIDYEIVFKYSTPKVAEAILRKHLDCKPIDIWR